MVDTPHVDVEEIKARYAPYHTMKAFEVGYADYIADFAGFRAYRDVDAQAYDRGAEAAMKVRRAAQWVEDNVGAD